MARLALIAPIVFVSLATGWAAAKAHTPQPDFELLVDAPVGQTHIKCVKGCTLLSVETMDPEAKPTPNFSILCGGSSLLRCPPERVGGWVAH